MEKGQAGTIKKPVDYFVQPVSEENYLVFFAAAFFAAVFVFAGLVLPKLPAKVFPFLVLISPRPISVNFIVEIDNKKARRLNSVLLLIFFPAN